MDIRRLILLSWHVEGHSDLNYDQLGQCLIENILTGFSFYSRKPYYGSFTPQGFAARRMYGKMKKTSLAPSVKGAYAERDGYMAVILSVSPHPLWLGIFTLFMCYGVSYWLASVAEIFRTWDLSLLIRGLFPLAGVYGIGWLVFQKQCETDLHFWKQVLQLREIDEQDTEYPAR